MNLKDAKEFYMLNLKKRCITSALCGVIMLTVSIPVVCASSFDHKNDEFDTWVIPGWSICEQKATFYCDQETHTASVVMQRNKSNSKTTYVGIAKKKYTARAASGSWNADLKTRRGYWDHRDYMFTPGDF